MRSEWFALIAAGASLATWILRAASRTRHGESADRPYDPDANRGPSGGEQVVGAECRVCEEPFMFAKDARPCPDCEVRVHEKCLEEHARAHLPDRPVYR